MELRYTLLTCAGAIALALTPMTAGAQSRADLLAGKAAHHPRTFVAEMRGGGAPANDECTSPEVLTVGTNCESPTAGDNSAATESTLGPACDPANDSLYIDVWYSFNSGTNTSVDVDLVPSDPMTDWVVVVMEACDGPELLCAIQPEAPESVPVTENTEYIVRVYSNTQYGNSGPFTICVSGTPPPPPPPANDECANAIVITTSADCVPVDGYTLMATESQPADSCNGYLGTANDDVWYTFTATATEMTINVQGGGTFDAVVELFEGDCSALSEIGCADATVSGELETIQQSGLNIGQAYLVRLFHYGAAETAPSDFTICAVEGLANIGIGEENEVDGSSIFPNPTTGPVSITWQGPSADVRIDVLDMTGRIVHAEQRHLLKGQVAQLSLFDRLAEGTYTVRLNGGGVRTSHPLIVR